MLQLPICVPPSRPRPAVVLSAGHGKTGRFDFFNHKSSMPHLEILEHISFPDPPRPPTPGPAPRPPPIPPRPPVPTPPPSPNSPEETVWLQGIVAKQLSIIAARLVGIWLAIDAPVSLPHPPRPPTPGPRPGPLGPRPDVPTPPPSPRRSAKSLIYGISLRDKNVEISHSDAAFSGNLFYEYLASGPRVARLPLKMTTSSYDSPRKQADVDVDIQKELYDDKLTDDPDAGSETGLHTFIYYSVAPKDVSDPHMSHFGSYKASESACSGRTLQAGTGTVRNDPGPSQAASIGQLPNTKTRSDLSIAAAGCVANDRGTYHLESVVQASVIIDPDNRKHVPLAPGRTLAGISEGSATREIAPSEITTSGNSSELVVEDGPARVF